MGGSWVYVPLPSKSADRVVRTRAVPLDEALVDLLMNWRSLDYLSAQAEVCRAALRQGVGSEVDIRYLGEKAAEYARQLLDEKYGKVPA